MDKALQTLTDIARRMEAIGSDMEREARAYREELADRQRLQLTGEQAVRHYNDWMEREGLRHLKVS